MSIAVYSIIKKKGCATIKLATPFQANCPFLINISGRWDKKEKLWFIPYRLEHLQAIHSHFKEVVRVGEVISVHNDIVPVR